MTFRILPLVAWIAASPAWGASAELVSRSTSGVQGNAFSVRPEISCDGQRIAFISMSTNLDEARSGASSLNIHLRKRDAGTTQLVSVGPMGPGAGTSVDPAISGSGRFVAFSSTADDLVEGIRPIGKQVYLFDAETSRIVLASRDAEGRAGNADSGYPSISADGRLVAFASEASNLVPGDTNSVSDVFLLDLASGQIQRVSVGASGEEATGPSDQASLSADGNRVAFRSTAANLVAGDGNGVADVFVRDLSTAVTQRASIGGKRNVEGNAASGEPSLSRDGSRVVFSTTAANFSNRDRNDASDIYLRDLPSGKTTLVSRGRSGSAGNESSAQPRISADGSHVVFLSSASSLVPGDANGRRDIFLVALASGKMRRINLGPAGEEANGNSYQPALSCDGTTVAFRSGASNLTGMDANFTDDVFVLDVAD